MNGRLIIMQVGRPGADSQMFRAYLPANPGGVRQSTGVTASTTGNIHWAIVSCAAKAFKKLNGGDVDEIETRVKISPHPLPEVWFAELQPGTFSAAKKTSGPAAATTLATILTKGGTYAAAHRRQKVTNSKRRGLNQNADHAYSAVRRPRTADGIKTEPNDLHERTPAETRPAKADGQA